MVVTTEAAGTLIAYGAALITARSSLGRRYKRTIESIALVTNAIPGMVLGVPTLAVLAALARQAGGAGLTARGLAADGAPARKDPPPQ